MSLEDARCLVGEYVAHYNTVCLHSAIGYVTPKDRLMVCRACRARRCQPMSAVAENGGDGPPLGT